MKVINNNPWEPSNEAQRTWIAKWRHEQAVCETCKKLLNCTGADRMNKSICQNLRERMTGGVLPC